jgi:hypothetical protein
MSAAWTEHSFCKSRLMCRDCRTLPTFRQSLVNARLVEVRDFECPHGFTAETAPAPPPPAGTVPRAEWPLWAKGLALLAKPKDVGLGDVIARVVGPFGGDAFKAWHKAAFGRDCGCQKRQGAWNALWPLK